MNEKIDKQISLTEKFQKEVKTNKNGIIGIKEQKKDMETNLKVVQNLVGENVVLQSEHSTNRETRKQDREAARKIVTANR